MQVPHEAVLLRVFIGESDRLGHKPLYEAIVLRARQAHLAGATVLICGFLVLALGLMPGTIMDGFARKAVEATVQAYP